MEKNYDIDQIEDFLNNNLTPEDQVAFEQEMATNAELAEEVEFHKDVLLGIDIGGPKAFKNIVTNVHADLKEEGFFSEKASTSPQSTGRIRSLGSVRVLAIAASFALLLLAGWWIISQPSSPQDLYAQHFDASQDVLSIQIDDRLAETGFGTNKALLGDLKAGMDAYNAGNFNQAITVFEQYQQAAPQDPLAPVANYYQALALMQQGNVDQAIGLWQSLDLTNQSGLQEDANWYLALCYLQKNDVESASPLLDALQDSQKYQEKAKNILGSL